jgi:predicted Fe-Mo cluster-binding NifX family protein
VSEPYEIGRGKPPSETRFRKGQSGNPRGRPKNRHRKIPYDAVLGQMVTVREDGRERRVTAAEAFLLQLTQKGLAGDNAAARASLEAIEKARERRGELTDNHIKVIIMSMVGIGADIILKSLGLAVLKYPEDEKRVRLEINPWIVEAALARFGERRLSYPEQQEVWNATRTPRKVRWPEWWSYIEE